MDEAVITYYRKLLKDGFEYAGVIENPTLYLDTVNENIPICGNPGNYLHLYIKIDKELIDDIKYLCSCDPPANVAVEIFCTLARGKNIEEVKAFNKEAFFDYLGWVSTELGEKAEGLIALFNNGLNRLYDP